MSRMLHELRGVVTGDGLDEPAYQGRGQQPQAGGWTAPDDGGP